MKKIYSLFILISALIYGVIGQAQSCAGLDITSTAGGSVCGEGSVTLEATSSGTGTDVFWYDSQNGGAYLGSGSTFETPSIDQTTSFWASEVVATGATENVGPVDNSIGTTSTSSIAVGTQRMYFDVKTSVTLVSVDIFPSAAIGSQGSVTIRDNNQNVLYDIPYTTTVTGGNKQTVNLNVALSPGTDYEIGQGSAINLYRNTTGAVFPYTSSGIEITGTSFNTGYYYWYYNWEISTGDVLCESTREEVVATVNNVADKEISTLPYVDTDDTANFDNNYSGTPGSNCGGTSGSYLDGNDVVYHYSSTSGQVVDIELSGLSGNNASVFVYESCDEIGTSCLAGAVNDGVSTDFSIDEFVMNDNTNYYIVVSSSDNPSTLGYTLNISQSTIDCADYTEGPEANEDLYFETGETLADLDVTGANITWYTDAAGTNNVPGTTAAVDATTYYVSQTLNGCESDLVEVELIEVDCSTFGITSVTNDTLTCRGIATLEAQATGNGSAIYWYDSPTGGEVINDGITYETPEVTSTTSYWVSEVMLGGSVPEFLGPNPLATSNDPSYITLSSAYSTDFYYTEFNVLQNTTLTSVDIYPSASIGSQGSIVVEDSSGNLIQEVTYTTTVTNGSTSDLNVQTVQLNIPLAQGQDYRIYQGNPISLYRSTSGASYPYTSRSLEITGNNFSSGQDYLYFFYNWQLGSADVLCESPRQEVQAIISTDGDIAVNALPYTDTNDTANFGNNFSGASGSNCGSSENYLNGDETIYKYVATDTELIDITLSDLSGFYGGVFVYESCADLGTNCSAGAVAGPSDDDFGVSAFEVTAGQEYYIVVSSWLNPSIEYTIDIAPFECSSLEGPDAATEQDYVAGSELSELTVEVTRTDASLNWYSDAAGTTSIPDTTVMVDNTTYYVNQTFEGCESPLVAITVHEIDCSVLGIVSTTPDTISCRGVAVLEAVSSGNETEIRWYDAATDGSVVATGESYTTPEITATTSYWVAEVIIFNEDVVCESARQEVVANVDQSGDVTINYTDLPYQVTDNTANYGNDFQGDVGTSCEGSDFLNGYETVYEYTEDAARDNILDITLTGYTKFNTGVFIYDTCGEIGQDCLEGATNDQGEVNIEDYYIAAGETIFIVVTSDTGTTNYQLEINGIDCNDVELPIGETQPYYVSPATLDDLEVEGNPHNTGFIWYSDAAGTNPIPSTTSIVDNTTYYVTQTILGCEGSALAITPQEFACSTMGTTNISASEDMICIPGGDITFTAQGSGVGNQIYWYDAATGGNLVGIGNTFTANVTEDTSYWASEVFIEGGSGNLAGVGLTDWTYSSSSSASSTYYRGLYFRADEAFTIYTVDVYDASSSGGTANIQLYDTDSDTMIESTVVTLPGGGSSSSPVKVTLNLNFEVPAAGNYKLVANDAPAMKYEYDYSNNYLQYPMSIGNYGEITMGGYEYTYGEYTYDYYYYYFYNWSVGTGEELCQSSRQEVSVTVNDQIPYAPTGFTLQEFCESDFDRNIMIQDLEAVGQDVQWYTSETGSAPLAPTTEISDGQIYYASQTIATCESDRRLSVTVIIDEASALPDGEMNQSFSQGETLEDLDVTGDNLIWYLDEDRTQEVDDLSDIALDDQETYYVTQNDEGYCESRVLAITVHEVLSVNGQALENLVYYPNPVKNSLHISNHNNIKSVEIYNLLGQKILHQNMMMPKVDVDLSHLPTAGYLLKITTATGKVGVYKLLKE